MQYIKDKKRELNVLLSLIKTDDSLVKLPNGVFYSKDEIEMKLNRIQRQIDGYKRIHSSLDNKSMTIKDFALYKALAIKEYEYFIEVENKLDTYTIKKIMSSIENENKDKVFFLINNINTIISERSSVVFKNKWIEDRTFELASVGQIVDFELVSESFYNINCLDSLMSGKISKEELEKANLWREIHKNHTNSIYTEVGNLLRVGDKAIKVP